MSVVSLRKDRNDENERCAHYPDDWKKHDPPNQAEKENEGYLSDCIHDENIRVNNVIFLQNDERLHHYQIE